MLAGDRARSRACPTHSLRVEPRVPSSTIPSTSCSVSSDSISPTAAIVIEKGRIRPSPASPPGSAGSPSVTSPASPVVSVASNSEAIAAIHANGAVSAWGSSGCIIPSSISFDTIAREWRCKWSEDGDKASLASAQKVLEKSMDCEEDGALT